ncbi:hypothetical protein OB2597_19356 [Pseudooceanicola batsensis HTCC2597]|uniref:Uncharacterized protein n=1 Tax=Pseudooceanicola batsensis (strain ATCC BAA-863 / DSM 15984 / KCTC 12145 / HTCC2597) TaxID=252305 RepID=A3U0I1_PSEBH|nr:hypothetical protein [Pseudooceanicola batsensis]EAQ02272.1 hypothetical protein OB2597_19356 [Pseudooceanicola batsensis HTCC2597]
MQISEITSRDPVTLSPDRTARNASPLVDRAGYGFRPGGRDDRLAGVLADRGIALGGIGRRHRPGCPLRDARTADARYCTDADDAGTAARDIAELQVRQGRTVDVASLGARAVCHDGGTAEVALGGLSRPGGARTS